MSSKLAPVIAGTVFRGNMSASGGAVFFWDCESVLLSAVLFVDNHAARGAALYLTDSSVTANRLTFAENGADWIFGMHDPYLFAGAVYGDGSSLMTLNTSLISFTAQGPGIHMQSPASAVIACTDFFANAGGYTSGTVGEIIGIDGNISEDPLFCGLAAGDYSLDSSSPCLPANNGCGMQMGAYGEGCTGTAGDETPPPSSALRRHIPIPSTPRPPCASRCRAPRPWIWRSSMCSGRRVARLLAGASRCRPGQHAVDWEGRDEAGRALP